MFFLIYMVSNTKWILTGIFIPVLIVFLTWFLDQKETKYELEYSYEGPIATAIGSSYSITITNSGKQIQEDIEVWLPTHLMTPDAREIEVTIDSTVYKLKDISLIEFEESQVKPEQTIENDYKVLRFKSLRPFESVTFSVLNLGNSTLIHSKYSLETLRIVSKHSVAKVIKNEDEFGNLYKALAYIFIVLLVLFFVSGIYFDFFYPKDKKIRYYEKEIDKLRS